MDVESDIINGQEKICMTGNEEEQSTQQPFNHDSANSERDMCNATSSFIPFINFDLKDISCEALEKVNSEWNSHKQLSIFSKCDDSPPLELSRNSRLKIEPSDSHWRHRSGWLQCTHCGKYQKPEYHRKCKLCDIVVYCGAKCRALDRQRHEIHDCLVRVSTQWFSIKRNRVCSPAA